MFAEGADQRGMVREGAGGWWAVHRSTGQYRAWRYWLVLSGIRKNYCSSDWASVPGQWPPMTQAEADNIAGVYSALRDELAKKDGGFYRAVPRHPEIWMGYIPEDDHGQA